jgi:RHS repeat-associated protein
MSQAKYWLKGLFIFSILLFGNYAKAQSDPSLIQILNGASGKLKVDSFVTVQDPKWWNSTEKAKIDTSFPQKIRNLVTLKINEESEVYIRSNFTTQVNTRIYYTNKDNVTDSTDYNFIVNYDTTGGARYNSQRLFTINNAYKLTTKILSINTSFPSGVASWNVTPLLRLENEMQIERYYKLNCDIVTPFGHFSLVPGADSSQLYVYWVKIDGATEYDLEWVYIDSIALRDTSRYGSFDNPDPVRLFDDGSTRITTTAEMYKIPLLYDNSGYIFSRVRAVQVKPNGQRVEAKWSTQYAGYPIISRYLFAGHERKLNWQATTSFAEEGKLKSVVQYYDGSLRARQTVTKDNSRESLLVAETFYDYQGRPTIQVLPAPKLTNLIGYVHGFNKALDGNEYHKSLYDSLVDYCSGGAPAMSSTSGTNNYYSINSPYSGILGSEKALPIAYGYAFAETRYSQDNTGRINAQGGVGEQHRIGSGHETRNYYGKPDQQELDALFGTEAGDATHYQKNMVRDANGQYSVSYVDMHGRTVATALAGVPAVKLDTLDSYSEQVITKSMSDPSSTIIDGMSMNTSTGLVVTRPGTHTFRYTLQPDSLRMMACDSSQICYDCVYNLEISISDECNNSLLPNGERFVLLDSNFTIGSFDTTCGNAIPGFDTTFSICLTEGSYTVSKKLTVSRPGFEYYRDSVFMKENLCKTFQDFYNEALTTLQNENCKPSCETCLAELGTFEEFHEKYIAENHIPSEQVTQYESKIQTAYDNAKAGCDILCDSLSIVDGIRDLMLTDMTPESGQYANPDVFEANFPYNIFHKNTLGSLYNFQNIGTGFYIDEDGKRDSIINSSGELVPPNHPSITKEDFIAQFKPSWAATLLPQHPEYCKLQKAEALKMSYVWDQKFRNTQTYAEAKAKGFLNPVGLTGYGFLPAVSGGTDPLSTLNPSLYNELKAKAQNYAKNGSVFYSIWGIATSTAHCNEGETSCFTTFTALNSAFDSTILCKGDLDMAWRSFQQLYLSEKEFIISKYLKLQCPSPQIPTPKYVEHFIDIKSVSANYASPDANSALAAAQGDMSDLYASTCADYASSWWHQLATCNFTAADSVVIMPRLIQVCKEGSDANHPFGSSTVKPGSSSTFRSFDDVIKYHLDSLGKTYNSDCNGYLITAPKSYEEPAPYTSVPIWTKPDSCQCANITEKQHDYLASGNVDSSFSAYLKRTANIEMTESDLQKLIQLCNTTTACKFLEAPIKIPAALQCGAADACLECDSVTAIHNRFITKFGLTPTYADNDSVQRVTNKLYGNYMNFHTGFSKSHEQYLQFLDTCSVYNSTSDTCASLKQLLKNFRNNYYFSHAIPPGYNSDGCDTTKFGVVNSEPLTNRWLKFAHLFKDGELHVPDSVYSHLPLNTPLDKKWEDSSNLKSFSTSFANACNLNNTFSWEMRVKSRQFAGDDDFPTGILLLADVTGLTGGIGNPYVYIIHDHPGGIYMEASPPSSATTTQLQEKFLDWKIITIKYQDNKIKVYFNGQFRFERTYTGNITQINKLVITFNRTEGYVDYQRLYDGQGNLIIAEEFTNACESFAVINPKYDCYKQSCDVAFTNYYNQQKGTSLTYTQIQQRYTQYCGKEAKPCQPYDDVPRLCSDGDLFPSVVIPDEDACSDSSTLAFQIATEKYRAYKDSLQNEFEKRYLAKCMKAYQYENFTVNAPVSEFHYTLYYYDQAGNLVRTVAPQGVDISKFGWLKNWSDSVKLARTNSQLLIPQHRQPTDYRYNTLNQVVSQNSPDGGKSEFWYDRLGRLVISRNAKQKGTTDSTKTDFSYTKYDVLGRITEVGEINNNNAETINDAFTRNGATLETWYSTNQSHRRQITNTYYDVPYAGFNGMSGPIVARNLRNRVVYTTITHDNNPACYDQASFYSYDIHGNVDTLLQDYRTGEMHTAHQRFKKLVYRYDLISGKVNQVAYQPGKADQFYHRYSYDAENKLTKVETSADSLIWENDASYAYLPHGPLTRTILGQQKVQGVDFGYTLQGWLKMINGVGRPYNDIGLDGHTDGYGIPYGMDTKVARDAYGVGLYYYTNDYSPVYGMVHAPDPTSIMDTAFRSLYNGNIASMSVYIPKIPYPINTFDGVIEPVMMYSYKYDQLNRIKRMDAYCGFNNPGSGWSNSLMNNKLNDYRERISYDANGNILGYLRNGTTQGGKLAAMDSLNYKYYPGTNRLRQVTDNVNASNYTEDIDNQSDASNYVYDAIGNLIQDKAEGINSIQWNVYGKINSIEKSNGTRIRYSYDAAGNRVSKTVTIGTDTSTTWYVRDATGNVMSTYLLKQDTVKQDEIHLYGSSRLGMFKPERFLTLSGQYGDTSGTLSLPGGWRGKAFTRGMKIFELSNHLGNVLVTVSDRKQQVPRVDTLISYYMPDVITANDYYPFGMGMPGRTYSATTGYRYGFNGKENDDEIKGEGDQQDYGMRIYDPRLGKFLSVDPLTKSYPMLTPYQFASNKPINSIDLDGGESKEVYQFYNSAKKLTESYTIDVNNPYDLGSGTFYHIYTVEEVTSTQINAQTVEVQQRTIQSEFYVPPPRSWLEQIGDWFSGKIPQVMVFGSGKDMSGNNGSKANYKKPLYSFNFKEFSEMMELIGQGMETPDLKEAEPSKVPELTKKLFDQVAEENPEDEGAKKLKTTNGTSPTPKIEPGKSEVLPNKPVYKRLDNYGTGRSREKKNTMQDHMYNSDTILLRKPAKDKSARDTFYIKQNIK